MPLKPDDSGESDAFKSIMSKLDSRKGKKKSVKKEEEEPPAINESVMLLKEEEA